MKNKLQIILTRGLPGSGKTTWCKAKIAEQPGLWVHINRDALREMFMEPHSKIAEKLAIHARNALIVMAIQDGKNVLVDDTNLSDRHMKDIKNLPINMSLPGQEPTYLPLELLADVRYQDFLDVPLEECIHRDYERGLKNIPGRSVGHKVIRKMWAEQMLPKIPKPEFDPAKPKAVICDIDGTVAEIGNRSPYDQTQYHVDEPKQEIIDILKLYALAGVTILMVSGREGTESVLVQTSKWLTDHDIPYDKLLTREAGDNRNDALIKKEIYENEIAPNYNVLFALDDRSRVVQMWREQGLTCLQVQPGDF